MTEILDKTLHKLNVILKSENYSVIIQMPEFNKNPDLKNDTFKYCSKFNYLKSLFLINCYFLFLVTKLIIKQLSDIYILKYIYKSLESKI